MQAHGLWVAPGSPNPNKNLARALEAIRLAREHLVPCLGTCGGFSALKLAQQSSSGPRQDGSSEPGCSRDQEQFAWSYRAAFRSLLRALVQYFALGPRVPGARIAECRNSGQKSQDRARLKKYRSWLGSKTRNQGCYWCAKLSANLGDPLLLDQHPIQPARKLLPVVPCRDRLRSEAPRWILL